MLYSQCPTLGAEQECLQDGNECLSADVTCSLCGLPGLCDDTAIGIDFVSTEEECLQHCKETAVSSSDNLVPLDL